MNKPADEILTDDDVKDHYDFDYSKAKPNRFAERLAQDSLMVALDPDMAAIFPTSEAVNEALRVLAAAAKNLSATKPPQRNRAQAKTQQIVQA
jgi:hypothetical protein